MKTHKHLTQLLYFLIMSMPVGFVRAQIPNEKHPDELFHLSTMDAMRNGIYEGMINIGTLQQHGDFALGTFHALDGEMVALDGVFYRITSTGSVVKANADELSPFASVTFFEADTKKTIGTVQSFEELQRSILASLPSKNRFYAIRIHSRLNSITLGGSNKVSDNDKRGIAELMNVRPQYKANNVSGTFVGFYNPTYIGGIDLSPFHIHFISDDRKLGGHVMEVSFSSDPITLELDEKNTYLLKLPEQSEGYNKNWNAASGTKSY